MAGLKVAVKLDGAVTIHCAVAYGDYDTACGIDANDPSIGHFGVVPVPKGAKIDCVPCKRIFEAMRHYRITDFK